MHNSARTIIPAEEPRSLEKMESITGHAIVNDCHPEPGWLTATRWDPLMGRYGGKAKVTFTDGQVEVLTLAIDAYTNYTPSGL
jgi:hypothetical protein